MRNGLTAEAAVERVQNDTRARMQRQTDLYIKDRLHDLDDLANRLLRVLTGDHQGLRFKELPDNAVLVVGNMGPAGAAGIRPYPASRHRARGRRLDLARGDHRVAGLVAVGQARILIVSMSETGDDIIVDGPAGTVHLRPTPEIEQSYVDKIRITAKRRAHYQELRGRPSVTRDGIDVTAKRRPGLVADLPMLLTMTGAVVAGLFRTELQFMIALVPPRLATRSSFTPRR